VVTLLGEDESEFWLATSRVSLDAVWDNTEDDIYAQLLEKSYCIRQDIPQKQNKLK